MKDQEAVADFGGAAARLSEELELLNIFDEPSEMPRNVDWVDAIRKILVSEHTRSIEDGNGQIGLTSWTRWPMFPGDKHGIDALAFDDVNVLRERIALLIEDLERLRRVIWDYRQQSAASNVGVPSPQSCMAPDPNSSRQASLFDAESVGSSESVTEDTAKAAMDELVKAGLHYQQTHAFKDLIRFVSRFRQYSPFNAMLVHLQMPEAQFVARSSVWLEKYGRPLRPGARPLIMLQPGGPTMPVYDVSDTAFIEGSRVPDEVANPFVATVAGVHPEHWHLLVDNAKMWGIRVTAARMGSPLAGYVMWSQSPGHQRIERLIGQGKERRTVALNVPIQFDVEIQDSQDLESRIITLLHELAHVVCGHLGAAQHKEWSDRSSQTLAVREFEAETTAFIAARRIDPAAQMPPYLHDYLETGGVVPDVSLDTITKAAGRLLDWLDRPQRVPKHLRTT